MSATPDLDLKCGECFTYRDLIECGETWQRMAVQEREDRGLTFTNTPDVLATFIAMEDLCSLILDPVSHHFGKLALTYGFASAALVRKVPSGIAPLLDQHAGHEVTRKGDVRCKRLGLAADFRVEGVNSFSLALWIARACPFDRLYVYGSERPVHVSVAPRAIREPEGKIVQLKTSSRDRRLPRLLTLRDLETVSEVERS
jgi:hypothetical protein